MGVSSSNFSIQSTGRLARADKYLTVYAVMNRSGQALSWREEFGTVDK